MILKLFASFPVILRKIPVPRHYSAQIFKKMILIKNRYSFEHIRYCEIHSIWSHNSALFFKVLSVFDGFGGVRLSGWLMKVSTPILSMIMHDDEFRD